ncbi:hypothetical protein BDZ45DRAFT_745463 [Acephala macrosclerotiorum]|nr:hypothetical protein BDZ45DRAFT_745463 [Acephala macrosclerotiorum]
MEEPKLIIGVDFGTTCAGVASIPANTREIKSFISWIDQVPHRDPIKGLNMSKTRIDSYDFPWVDGKLDGKEVQGILSESAGVENVKLCCEVCPNALHTRTAKSLRDQLIGNLETISIEFVFTTPAAWKENGAST